MRYFRDVETDSLVWDASTDLVWLKDGAHGIPLGELESCLDCPEHLRVELRELKVAVREELYGSAWTAAPKPFDVASDKRCPHCHSANVEPYNVFFKCNKCGAMWRELADLAAADDRRREGA